MDFKYEDLTLLESAKNSEQEINSYMIVSATEPENIANFENIVQLIDEKGNEISCTYEKILEIFDTNENKEVIL